MGSNLLGWEPFCDEPRSEGKSSDILALTNEEEIEDFCRRTR